MIILRRKAPKKVEAGEELPKNIGSQRIEITVEREIVSMLVRGRVAAPHQEQASEYTEPRETLQLSLPAPPVPED